MRALLPGTPDTASFVEEFNRVNGTLAGNGLPWLDSLRRSGIEMFEALGFPSTHNEPWKYTGLWSLGDTVFKAVNGDDGKATVDLVPSLLPMSSGHPRIVFVNGRMRPDLSRLDALPEGVTVQSLGEAMVSDPDWVGAYLGRIGRGDGQSLMALNTAMMDSGTVIRVRKGVIVEQPIEIVYIAGLTDAEVIVDNFWDSVANPYTSRLITKTQVRDVIGRALAQTGGNYRKVVRLLNMQDHEYKRFMDFLRRHRCNVDFRPYRRKEL